MRGLQTAVWTALLGILLVIGPAACGGASSADYPGHGVATEIDAEARTVTLDHEDIPGFMKAMTMTFTLAPDVALDGIDPGAKVDFRVKDEGGVYTVTAIRGSGS